MRDLINKARWAALFLAAALPVLFWWQWLLPRQEALANLRHDVEHLRAEASSISIARQGSSTQTQLSELMQRLGNPDQLPDRVAQLHKLLRDNGVVLAKAGYKLVYGGESGINRYEIQLEIDGPYYGVRLFLRSLLKEDEAIALDSLDLHRQPGSGNTIQASMRWTMFVKGTD